MRFIATQVQRIMKFLPDGIGFEETKKTRRNKKANELFMYAAKKLKSEFILYTRN